MHASNMLQREGLVPLFSSPHRTFRHEVATGVDNGSWYDTSPIALFVEDYLPPYLTSSLAVHLPENIRNKKKKVSRDFCAVD